ncbi:MAG: hypothetical protein ACJ79H_19845 [Myxococcales bacterium]
MRKAGKIAAAALLFAPALFGWLFVAGLLLRPVAAGWNAPARGASSVAIGPLRSGSSHALQFPPAGRDYRAVLLDVATWETAPIVRWTACASQQCSSALRWPDDNGTIDVPLPAGVRGGTLTLTVDWILFGEVGYWGRDAANPSATAVHELGWTVPLGRAGDLARRMSGLSLAIVLGIHAAVLGAALIVALWQAFHRHPSGPAA